MIGGSVWRRYANELGRDFASGCVGGATSVESAMSVTSALSGYTFGFWSLVGGGVLLFLIAPLIQKLMHGVK